MPTLSVRFTSSSTDVPTLGYIVSYKRVGVDASPTYLPVNPTPSADQNGYITIAVPNLLEGYQYQITVQPQCSPTSVGTMLTFTKILAVSVLMGRDPGTSTAACLANKTIPIYAPEIIKNGTQLYTTQDVDTNASVKVSLSGWYSDGNFAYNVNSSGVVTARVTCL